MNFQGKHRLIRGGGLIARISDDYGPNFPVVGDDFPYLGARDVVASCVGAVRPMETVSQWNRAVWNDFRLPCSDSEDSDDDVLSVGVVRPLTTAAPLGGAVMMVDCQLHADSKDEVLSMGACAPMNQPGMRCVRLDDFDWVVPPYDPDMVVPGWDMDVGVTDVGRDIHVLPDVFPVVVEETAVMPMALPVAVETGPQVGCEPDLLLSERDVEVDIADIRHNIPIFRTYFR